MKRPEAIFFIGLGIFCAVIGLQLGLHNLKNGMRTGNFYKQDGERT